MITALVNVTLLTLDSARRIIPDGCLIFQGDRIEAVGERAELAERVADVRRTIDGRGMVALPGFVNAHTHSFQSLLRGLADGQDLLDMFIAQASVAIQNARLFLEAQRGREVAEALARLGGELTGTLDLERIADLVARGIVELLGGTGSAVYR